MKIALTLSLVLICLTAQAQNYAVRLYGTNTTGIPANYPAQVQPVADGATVTPPFIFMSAAQLANCIATNQAAYASWESNQTYQARAAIDANLAALVTSYSNLQWIADRWEYVTNIANLRIAVQAEGQVLLRLKPVLQQLYNGQQ